MSVCVLSFLCVCSHFVSLHPQILNFPGSHFNLNRHNNNSGKWKEARSRAARRGGLLGWLEWNGFAMVTAGKGPGKEAFGQAGESRGLYSERLLIKRHYEALSTIARIYSRCKWMWGGIRVVGEINSNEQSTQDTGGKEKRAESGDKKGNWWKKLRQCGVVKWGAGTHRTESSSHQVCWEQIPEKGGEKQVRSTENDSYPIAVFPVWFHVIDQRLWWYFMPVLCYKKAIKQQLNISLRKSFRTVRLTHLNDKLFTGLVCHHMLPTLWLFSQDLPLSPLFPKFPDRAVVLALIYCLVRVLLKQIATVFTRIIYSWRFHCIHLLFTDSQTEVFLFQETIIEWKAALLVGSCVFL